KKPNGKPSNEPRRNTSTKVSSVSTTSMCGSSDNAAKGYATQDATPHATRREPCRKMRQTRHSLYGGRMSHGAVVATPATEPSLVTVSTSPARQDGRRIGKRFAGLGSREWPSYRTTEIPQVEILSAFLGGNP